MRDFCKATPERNYEVYCPKCKQRSALTWEDMEWLQLYQRVGQHPAYLCYACPTNEYGMHQRMQVRTVRQLKETRAQERTKNLGETA